VGTMTDGNVIAFSYPLGSRFSPRKVRSYDTEKFARSKTFVFF
jgi:hypothetical protein